MNPSPCLSSRLSCSFLWMRWSCTACLVMTSFSFLMSVLIVSTSLTSCLTIVRSVAIAPISPNRNIPASMRFPAVMVLSNISGNLAGQAWSGSGHGRGVLCLSCGQCGLKLRIVLRGHDIQRIPLRVRDVVAGLQDRDDVLHDRQQVLVFLHQHRDERREELDHLCNRRSGRSGRNDLKEREKCRDNRLHVRSLSS